MFLDLKISVQGHKHDVECRDVCKGLHECCSEFTDRNPTQKTIHRWRDKGPTETCKISSRASKMMQFWTSTKILTNVRVSKKESDRYLRKYDCFCYHSYDHYVLQHALWIDLVFFRRHDV